MTSFYYYDQNLSGVCFLVQFNAFVIQTTPQRLRSILLDVSVNYIIKG